MTRTMQPAGRQVPPPEQVRIQRVGVDGDGVGSLASGVPVYVPFTLPGEAVAAVPLRPRGEGWLAEAASIEQPSGGRVGAPCGFFGRCGGCALQHWAEPEYGKWKLGLLVASLERAGFAMPDGVRLIPGLPGVRRRLDFAVRRERGNIVLGLHAMGSAVVVDLTECLVLHPGLMALLAPLRPLLQGLQAVRREASVVINLLDSGPDLLLRTDAALSLADRNGLIALARAHGMPRVSWALGRDSPEPVCGFRPAATTLSGVEVQPPPGVFLQATRAGERAIVEAVQAGLPARFTGRSRIAEMFCGCGTLTFALAKSAAVTAWDGDAGSVAALAQAANRAGMAGRIQVSQRDLARQPLAVKELAGFSAVVLDPPHAGAGAQIAAVAAAGVATVVYVSCNPATLGRDARTLHDAGYALVSAMGIDQFLWSARLEAVCVFRRGV